MKKKTCKYILLISIQCLMSIVACYSQELDLSFGNGTGKVTIPIQNNDQCNSVSLQQDGKIVLAGYSAISNGSSNDGFSIVRLNQDGTLDNNFNSNGKKVLSLNPKSSRGAASKIDQNGKIIIGGNTLNFDVTKNYFGIANLNTDGSLNTAFNSTGIDTLSIDLSNYNDNITSVDLSSSRILLAGYSASVSYNRISVAVLQTNGNFDNSFNTNGTLLLPVADGSFCYSAKFQKDGKILLSSYYSGNFKVIRLNADGSSDNTFGGGTGQATINFSGTAYSIALQKDGKILIGGGDNNQFALARLNTDGTPDNSFGPNSNGKLSFSIGGTTNICYSIAVDTFAAVNKIIMAGYSYVGSTSNFAVARIDLNGNIESKALIPIGVSTSVSIAKSVSIQPDSKIVVAGYANNGTDDDFAVIRLLPDFITTDVVEPEALLSTGVNVFPNPASYQLNVHSSYNISDIAIYNALGELIISVTNNNDVSSVVDISSLNKGIYTAVITTDKGNAVKKVVKQ